MSYTVNITAELQRFGIDYKPLKDNEVACKCPFHEDNSPSLHINLDKGSFICRASQCAQTGDFVAFLARSIGITRALVTQDLSTRYNLSNEATVDPAVVERWHNKIWKAYDLLAALRARGIKDEDIRFRRLGEHNGRVTIPIKNESGLFVNIRSYLPGAPGADKMKNMKGRAKKLRLYPYDQLSYGKLIVCGGEMKAIVTARVLNKHGYGAVCVTGGEGAWEQYLNAHFLGKPVWIMLDIDEAGVKATELVARNLSRTASELFVTKLPLDPDAFPKGDVNDYVANFVDMGNGDLLKVVETSENWHDEKRKRFDDKEEAVCISLTQSAHADFTGKRIRVVATVSTIDTSPYVIPKDVMVECSRDQDCCAICQVSFNDPTHLYQIHPESPAILDMVGQRKSAQSMALKEELSIPELCRVCRFEPNTYWNVEDTRLSPQLEITNSTAERTLMPAVCIGDKLELNESYEMIGRMHPNPMTQQSTLVISTYKATHDALSNYKLTDIDGLNMFKPDDWTVDAVQSKLDSIYEDFECNVTNIYQRKNLHVMIDLAYHSALLVQLDDKPVKGWVEVLILGDSAQGKSETALNMQRHYGLGAKVECKNATVAGLLGGLQQMGSRWFVSWGLWPTHDRRLIILEELKGASTAVIGKLTDMRSSGFAELPKIERRRTYARTRMIALSNPRSNLSLDRYNYGITAIAELIGSLEDVRRFDAVMLVEKSEVDSELINAKQIQHERKPHIYTSEKCRELILWCWTRDKAMFTEDARSLVLSLAKKLCEDFSDTIPIVDKGSIRYKLSRLAASVAGRTYSATDDGLSVLVRTCHVEFVYNYLIEVYSTKAMGYSEFTRSERANTDLSNPDQIVQAINATPYAHDLAQNLMHSSFIEIRDLMDWCRWNIEQCNTFISLLVRKRALKRVGRAYVKTASFITLLRDTKIEDKPEHLKEDF